MDSKKKDIANKARRIVNTLFPMGKIVFVTKENRNDPTVAEALEKGQEATTELSRGVFYYNTYYVEFGTVKDDEKIKLTPLHK